MLICSNKKANKRIEKAVTENIAYYSSEDWDIKCCEGVVMARKYSRQKQNIDFLCLDVTQEGAIAFAEHIRRLFPNIVLQIIADSSISPMSYLNPSIMAVSLLLKPYDKKQLCKAVQEMFQYALIKDTTIDQEECFIIEIKGDRIRIEYSSIVFFESREKKIIVMSDEREYCFYNTIDSLEKILPGNFIRSHRSFIFNLSRVQEIKMAQNTIIMNDGNKVPISRSYRSVVKENLI
ncbi:LytR/AlgR family response regulator transcription factor [Anaerosporobacter sp.]